MNYRHAFHAGNHADVLKHIVMARIIEHLKRKEAPFRVFDAHAGIGVYGLDGVEAGKTREWEGGIAKMGDAFAPEVEALLAPYRSVIVGLNPEGGILRCPGSPEVISRLVRKQDRFTLNELHPADYDTMKERYYNDLRASITGIDATVLMKANLPPPERRGLVLIDPSYEVKNERELVMEALKFGHRRFASGVFLIWYPVKGVDYAEQFCDAFEGLGIGPMLKIEMRVREAFDGGGLAGSGLLVVNPPYTLEAEMKVLGPALAARLGIGEWGRCEVVWLVSPESLTQVEDKSR
jgi:23S rRNA (adenine2030-N6)-methyltransferase